MKYFTKEQLDNAIASIHKEEIIKKDGKYFEYKEDSGIVQGYLYKDGTILVTETILNKEKI